MILSFYVTLEIVFVTKFVIVSQKAIHYNKCCQVHSGAGNVVNLQGIYKVPRTQNML